MKRRTAGPGVFLVVVLLLASMLQGPDRRELTSTTFGVAPNGYRGLFDLLATFGYTPSRLFYPATSLPPESTLWTIEPFGACPGERSASTGLEELSWVEAGGTLVVLLPAGQEACPLGGGIVAPARVAATSKEPYIGRGTLHPGARSLEGSASPQVFTNGGDWTVRSTLNGSPFVLEHAHGAGRLVVVADARRLSNDLLDRADAAPFAVDLMTYGVPIFDERGFAPRPTGGGGGVGYLVRSPARWVFVGLGLLGLLVAWWGARFSVPTLREAPPVEPDLGAYADSVATLYARTHDWPRLLVRYRELTLHRLRRGLGLPRGTPASAIHDRLRRRGRVVAPLLDDTPVLDEAALRTAIRSLDELAREATR